MSYLRASSSVRRIELICASLRIVVTQSIIRPPTSVGTTHEVLCAEGGIVPVPVHRILLGAIESAAHSHNASRQLEQFSRDIFRFNFMAHQSVVQMIL